MSTKGVDEKADLLRRLRSDPDSFLSGKIEGIVSEVMSLRPIFRVCCISSGASLVLKLSRLSEPALASQLQCISVLAKFVDFVPTNYGYCVDGFGRLYEIWDWLEEAKAHGANLPGEEFSILKDLLIRFVSSSSRVPTPPSGVFPNKLALVAKPLFCGGQIAQLIAENSVTKVVRDILSSAMNTWARPNFLNELNALPNSFVHSDIRAENIRSRFLLDYSNSKFDARLLELTRFSIINFEHTNEIKKLIESPSAIFGETELTFTTQEARILPEVATIDFACVYWWARQQILENAHRAPWAGEFILRCPDHFQECFSTDY